MFGFARSQFIDIASNALCSAVCCKYVHTLLFLLDPRVVDLQCVTLLSQGGDSGKNQVYWVPCVPDLVYICFVPPHIRVFVQVGQHTDVLSDSWTVFI